MAEIVNLTIYYIYRIKTFFVLPSDYFWPIIDYVYMRMNNVIVSSNQSKSLIAI